MREKHNRFISLSTLKHRFAKYKLSGNETWRDEEEVKTIIKEEIQGLWLLVAFGLQKMWHVLKIKHTIVHVPRNMFEQILHGLDPEASSLRKKKKRKRRRYLSHRPNQCWHIDGKHHHSFLLFNK